MATQPVLPSLPVASRPRPSTSRSRSTRARLETARPSLFRHPPAYDFPRSADLAGRSVRIAPEIPTAFDRPLAAHHKLIGRWVASRDSSATLYTRGDARRHIENSFNQAVLGVLDRLTLADLRIVVLNGEEIGPPAVATICESMGQLDLGWIENSDAPISWRATAYAALEQTLGSALPIFNYQDLFDEISIYYWDGETDDEGARQSLIHYQGADPDDLEEHALPSTMNARKPEWMIAANSVPLAQLPNTLRRALRRLRQTHEALRRLPQDHNAWRFNSETLYEYIPGLEECSALPPLTLVPVEFFAAEVDDVGRHGMEYGFMDVAGLCPLPDADTITHWFASLELGTQFLLAAQYLIELDPAKLRGSHVRP